MTKASARYIVDVVSIGNAGLTQRPIVYDTWHKRTVKVYRGSGGLKAAEAKAAKLNDVCDICGWELDNGQCTHLHLHW